MIDYIDILNYSAINAELSWNKISVEAVINIETKKDYFRIWFKKK